MDSLKNWIVWLDLSQFLKDNHPLRLAILAIIILVLLILAKGICAFARSRLVRVAHGKSKHIRIQSKAAEKIIAAVDDNLFGRVFKTGRELIYVLILFWGFHQLTLDPFYMNLITMLFFTLSTWVAIRFLSVFVPFNLDLYLRRHGSTIYKSQTRSLLPIIKGVIWAAGLTFLLDNFGFSVSTIIAGLGIVGVAVGLAGQAILSDFFSYIVILLDKPFIIGDFIVMTNGKQGQVIYIGPKTTRLLSLDNNVIVCANTEMTRGVLENQGAIKHREVSIEVGVALTVSMDLVKKVPAVLKEVVNSFPQCTFERACMTKFGSANYIFELIYHVTPQTGSIGEFMQTQSDVNLAFTERMNKEGMVGAYPTQSLLITQELSQPQTPPPAASS